jgi:hypothetical protein
LSTSPRSQHHLVLSAILVLATGVSLVVNGCSKKPSTEGPSSSTSSSMPSSAPPPAPTAAPSGTSKVDFVTAVKATNPLAYYRLEATGGSSEVGSSIYASKGGSTSSSSCAPIGVAGNKCVALDGKDSSISTTQIGGITTAGSIMAWVNLSAMPKDANRFFYVAGESQSGNDFDVQFESDNNLKFYGGEGSPLTYTPTPASLVNQWHMIVVTMDVASHSRVLYWDGQPAALDQTPSLPNKTGAFAMGDSPVFTGRFLAGSMDEVALWNRILTPAEVTAIYNSTK